MRQNGSGDRTVIPARGDPGLRAFEIPVSKLVPDEATSSFRVFAQSQSAAQLGFRPNAITRTRRSERGIALRDRLVQSMENPLVRPSQALRRNRFDRLDSLFTDVRQEKPSNVPELGEEVSSGRKRLLEIVRIEHDIGAHAQSRDYRVTERIRPV